MNILDKLESLNGGSAHHMITIRQHGTDMRILVHSKRF
jgi:hypothetical protein